MTALMAKGMSPKNLSLRKDKKGTQIFTIGSLKGGHNWPLYTLLIYVVSYFLLGNEMPSFTDVKCPKSFDTGHFCIKVVFASKSHDLLILKQNSKVSSIYEGYLEGDEDVIVTMINSPEEKERMVSVSFLVFEIPGLRCLTTISLYTY